MYLETMERLRKRPRSPVESTKAFKELGPNGQAVANLILEDIRRAPQSISSVTYFFVKERLGFLFDEGIEGTEGKVASSGSLVIMHGLDELTNRGFIVREDASYVVKDKFGELF